MLSPAAYTYDAENRLTSTAGVSYTYDGDGQRVMKSTGVLYWYGLGGEVLAEVVGGSWQKEYFYVNGELLASHDRGPAWVRYYFRDHLGTPRVIARPDGSKCYDADYYPFGGERVYLNNCPDNYKFTGYERDAESDLDYAVHRYYSYRIGRFQTPEPCALTSSACSGATVSLRLFNPAQQSPAETNLYTYVVNNPLNRTDPEGLWWGCPWWDPWCGRGECHGYGRACWPGGGWPRRGVVIIIFFRESKRARCLRSAWNVFKECWTGEAGLVCGEALLTAYVICRFAGWTLPCHLAVGAAVAVCIYEGGVCGLEAVREYNRCMAH